MPTPAAATPHRLFSYAACSTCRKALSWLTAQGLHPGRDVLVVDITVTPPSEDDLRRALAQLGRSRMFNTSGQSYRTLGAATVKAMADDEAIAALAADGRLIKRPFLITAQGDVVTGFNPEEWQPLLAR